VNIETMTVPLIAYLATIFVMGLVQWYLIYARDRAQIPPVPVGPPGTPSVKPGPVDVPPVKPPVITPPVTPVPPAGSDFDRCVALVLKYEGGNDDDPQDPGGRTSRGILQREWDTWRNSHPGLPPDVWEAPQDQVLAIYKEQYWNALWCDSLPPGVDLAVFDFGVNSGVSRSAKFLQVLVGTDQDGEVGPDTIAATAKVDPVSLVGQFCDRRLAFLQGLSTWGRFGKGWTSRVVDVRKEALALASQAPQPKPPVIASADGVPPWLAAMRAVTGTHEGHDNPVILGFAAFIAKKYPEMSAYCARYTHDSIAWCGLTVAYCMASAGIRPQFGATDTDKFLWADSWRQFGVAVSEPKPGDIICVKWPSGGHHVTLYESTNGANYMCRGGNQSDAVDVMAVPKSSVSAIRRPAP
jgi:uncharacterized protein (TIGR02594 family)